MSLLNISPIDGRYNSKTKNLSEYFSEFGFMKYRVEVEIKYFLFLASRLQQLKEIDILSRYNIYKIWTNFSLKDCELIKLS